MLLQAVDAHLFGGFGGGEQVAIIGCASEKLRIPSAEGIYTPCFIQTHPEAWSHSYQQHGHRPRGCCRKHRQHPRRRKHSTCYSQHTVCHLKRARSGFLLGAMIGVVIFGSVVVRKVESRGLRLHKAANVIHHALLQQVMVHAVCRCQGSAY